MLLLAALLSPGAAAQVAATVEGVKLAEGSLVKLGENGTLRFTELSTSRGAFKAALPVGFIDAKQLAQWAREVEI